MIVSIVDIVIYLITETLNYVLGYVVIFNCKLTKNKSRWVIFVGLILTIHLIILYGCGIKTAESISVISMILIPFLLMDKLRVKHFLIYPFIIMSISVVAVSCSFILSVILNISEYEITQNWLSVIICEIIPVVLMIIIIIFRRIKNIRCIEIKLDWKQYMLFYIVTICTLLLIGPVQRLIYVTGYNNLYNLMGFIISIVCIVLILITIWQGVIVNRQIKSEERNRMYEKYIKLQKEYYNGLINQDNQLRKFKHDLNAHIAVLSDYCNSINDDRLKKYIDDFISESAIFEVVSYTGNRCIDAIISNQIMQAAGENIHFDVKGNVPRNIDISEFDICVVLSNLIKNAIEACERIEDIKKRNIYIEIGMMSGKLYISIKNPINISEIRDINKLGTLKTDKVNHGLGLNNIRDAIEKYNGVIDIRMDNECFVADVCM